MIHGASMSTSIGWSEPGRTTLEIETGSWRTRRPLYVEACSPCSAACPAGEPIARWIEQARTGNYAAAWALIREENPFPGVMGRVCAHPCESRCNRVGLDGAVAINALERAVGEWGLRHGTVTVPQTRRDERIAVVGSGPAGLACAYHLARFGYRVTIFEAAAEPGGLLRHGIPAYRLPRAVLDREIEMILALGITLRTGHRFDARSWDALADWDAVCIATGAAVPLTLGVPGVRARGVHDGLAMLRAVNGGERPALGTRAVVVGGGSTAMDVARTARRLGVSAVTVVALETREAMPADADELAQAVEEGIEIRSTTGVRAFRERDGVLTGVVVAPAHLERRPDGAITAVFGGGPDEVIATDSAVLAIGQRPDFTALRAGLDVVSDVVGVSPSGATSIRRVYAGGDVASRQRTVAHAIGAGTRAARAIDAAITGAASAHTPAGHAWVVPRAEHLVTPTEVGFHAFAPARRAERARRPATARVSSFEEVVGPLDDDDVRSETERCFTCGRCVGCDTCMAVCPDMAITRVAGAYHVASSHCKGCGLCAHECPRGALHMVSER
jgi:NADPH-dependent glutamate synthase beta subunit-like oxidoreductase